MRKKEVFLEDFCIFLKKVAEKLFLLYSFISYTWLFINQRSNSMKKTIKLLGLLFVAAMVFAGCANASSGSSEECNKEIEKVMLTDGNWEIDVKKTTEYSSLGKENKSTHIEITVSGKTITVTKWIEKDDKKEEDRTDEKKRHNTSVSDVNPEVLLRTNNLFITEYNSKVYTNEDGTKFRATGSATRSVPAAFIAAFAGSSENLPSGDITITYNGEAKYAKKQ